MHDYVRRSARVVLLDAEDRILLVRSGFGRSVEGVASAWFVPGGRVEGGESLVQAAVREVAEGTGLVLAVGSLLPLAFSHGSGRVGETSGWMRDDFFWCPAPDTVLDASGMEAAERAVFERYRWWTTEELAVTEDPVFPRGLAGVVADQLAGAVTDPPRELPW
ncbi:MAG TPA: NUDIX domain-containing protein [Candidatus Avipropionibacterium avicola]|uniref:NUDIX domain-containing protein n=1 Tax=Candidatus Avipropionibacterium avicola TaxID=2840701 RepID=A0A9D1GXQ4_9ACTN|nr:NUDIX domain-containing protein [Candidatus Avipropionibacterium avicola]